MLPGNNEDQARQQTELGTRFSSFAAQGSGRCSSTKTTMRPDGPVDQTRQRIGLWSKPSSIDRSARHVARAPNRQVNKTSNIALQDPRRSPSTKTRILPDNPEDQTRRQLRPVDKTSSLEAQNSRQSLSAKQARSLVASRCKYDNV